MPLTEAENLVVTLTDPRISGHQQDIEDSLIKVLQTEPAILSHSLRFLSHKVQSPCEREAVNSLLLLDNLAKRGGRTVQSEMGKFRFLNELIKVVSPKYLGEKTTEKVRKKTIDMLYAWSQMMRYEQKIVEAYNMLKQQGIISEDPVVLEPPPPISARPKNPIIEDEERAKLLRRLLQSKEPADMVAANRLIKSMVREDDQRMEKIIRRHSDLVQIKENARLLLDMLKQYAPSSSTSTEREIMRQLFDSCEQHRPRVFKLAAEIAESNIETEEGPNLADILVTSDELTEAIQQYRALGLTTEKFDHKQGETAEVLLSLDSAFDGPSSSHAPLPHAPARLPQPPKEDVLSLLDEVFSASNVALPPVIPYLLSSSTSVSKSSSSTSLPLQNEAGNSALSKDLPLDSPSQSRKTLVDFDAVTHTFLGDLSLGDRNMKGRAFAVETKPRPSLNELQRDPLLSDKSKDMNQNRLSSAGDDEIIGEKPLSRRNDSVQSSPFQNGDVDYPESLNSVFVQAADIEPSQTPPIPVYQRNKVSVVFHLAKNKPRQDAIVIAALTTNHNPVSVKDFVLDVSVPKPMRIKIQPLTATDLPAFNPIFPPSPSLQVIVVAKRDKELLRMQYTIRYSIDGRTYSDNGDVPYFDDL